MQFKKITDKNYIHIEGFMRTQLNLKSNELLVYAVIYGFSQDGKNQFTGSLDYLVELIGATRKTIFTTLQNLCDRNLIIKEKSGNNSIYYVNLECVKITHQDNDDECVKITHECVNSTNQCVKNTHECVKITHNNKYNNKNNKKDNNKIDAPAVASTSKKPKNSSIRKTKKEKSLDRVIGKLQEYEFSEKVENKILEFYEDRIEKKDYPAENQLTMTLDKLAGVSEKKQLQALDNSISNGYKGIFLDSKKDEYDGIHIRDISQAEIEREQAKFDEAVEKGDVFDY